MHMFPQLRKIEAKYQDRVLVVGVHSPKFPAERETANLREAVLRYRIEHPVVNDRDFQVWHAYGGRAWPTLMFIDPAGRVIGKHEGELPFETFDPLVDRMLRDFAEQGLLAPGQASLALQELIEPAVFGPTQVLDQPAHGCRRRHEAAAGIGIGETGNLAHQDVSIVVEE